MNKAAFASTGAPVMEKKRVHGGRSPIGRKGQAVGRLDMSFWWVNLKGKKISRDWGGRPFPNIFQKKEFNGGKEFAGIIRKNSRVRPRDLPRSRNY